VRVTGLTDQSWAVAAALFLVVFHMHSSRGSCVGSGWACMCAGGALCGFSSFGCLRSLLEHSFVLDVSSRCPCLRGPRLVSFKWSFSLPFFGFRSFVGVSFYLFFLFFSRVTICVCCQCTHQGGDWGPCVVWGQVDGHFLVWRVIDNILWTNSWLSFAGAGCGLTSVGAGEELVWKVVSGEAFRCGEDN
jgi:hypothetical protein